MFRLDSDPEHLGPVESYEKRTQKLPQLYSITGLSQAIGGAEAGEYEEHAPVAA